MKLKFSIALYLCLSVVLEAQVSKHCMHKKSLKPWESRGVKLALLIPIGFAKLDNTNGSVGTGFGIGFSEYFDVNRRMILNYSLLASAYKLDYEGPDTMGEPIFISNTNTAIGGELLLGYKMNNTMGLLMGYSNNVVLENFALDNFYTTAFNYYKHNNHLKLTYQYRIMSFNEAEYTVNSYLDMHFISIAYVFTF